MRNKRRVRDSVVYTLDEKGKRISQRHKGPARTTPKHGKVHRIAIAGGKVYLGSAPTRAAAVEIKLAAVNRARKLHLEGATPGQIRAALALAT